MFDITDYREMHIKITERWYIFRRRAKIKDGPYQELVRIWSN